MNHTKHSRFAILGLALAIIAFAAPQAAVAQGSSATATQPARAEVIAPLTLINLQPLNFGKMIKNFTTGSHTLVLTPPDPTLVSSDPAALIPMGGHDDGMMRSTGQEGEEAQIFTADSFELTKEGVATPTAQQIMTVSNIQFYSVQTGLIGNGTFGPYPAGPVTIETGGTLTVNGDDEYGVYNGFFDVTIAYL